MTIKHLDPIHKNNNKKDFKRKTAEISVIHPEKECSISFYYDCFKIYDNINGDKYHRRDTGKICKLDDMYIPPFHHRLHHRYLTSISYATLSHHESVIVGLEEFSTCEYRSISRRNDDHGKY
jgi:hypothetical protein